MVTLIAAASSAAVVGLVGWTMLRSRGRSAVAGRRRWRPREVPGLDVARSRFWMTVLGVAAVTFISLLALTRVLVVSVVPSLVVATLPHAYYTRRAAQRSAAVQQAWPDGLRDLVAAVRSGASVPAAIEGLAMFGPAPLREAFHGFGVYARSLGVVPALEMIRDDLSDPTTDRVIEVLILAYERGGPVVPEILTDLAEATTKDAWAVEQINTDALEQRINSRIVFILPWIVLVAMTTRSGAFRDFYSTSAGFAVVIAGGVMSLVGILIATRLGNQPPEPRVFGGNG